jgi:hypothetical protein
MFAKKWIIEIKDMSNTKGVDLFLKVINTAGFYVVFPVYLIAMCEYAVTYWDSEFETFK